MDQLEQIDEDIKSKTKELENYIDLVNRTIEKEFRLKVEIEYLTKLKKQIVLKRNNLQ